MSMSIESALTNCFDQTTPTGSGNPFMAMWNSLFFKNSHVPIQRGVKELYLKDERCMCLLMYLHTDAYTYQTINIVKKE